MLSLVFVAASLTTAASPSPVAALAYHPNGKVVAAGLHGRVRLHDTADGHEVAAFDAVGRVTALAFDHTGGRLAVACGAPGRVGRVVVRRVGPDGTTGVTAVDVPKAHADSVYGLAFSPDGRALATAGYDRLVHLWTLPEDKASAPTLDTPTRTLKDHSDTVYAVAFSPDGSLLATAAADRAVKVWDPATGTRLYTLGDATDWVYALAWTSDGGRLAAGGVDKSVRVWAAKRDGGRLLRSAFAHDRAVLRVAFAPDGKSLLSLGEEGVVKAWDADALKETAVVPVGGSPLAFALRPDGKQFAVGRHDGTATLFDAATGKPQATLATRTGRAGDDVRAVKATATAAAPKPPAVKSVTPAFAARGTTTTVTFRGDHLDGVKAVAAGRGVTVTPGLTTSTADTLTATVAVAADAPVGPVALTLEGDAGKSAPVTFVVDRFPAVAEAAGGTDSARVAMTVKLPVTVVGAIDRAGDADFFRFDAAAEQQVGVQVVAAELGSKLEPVLVLTDADGRTLAEGVASLGYTVPKTGTYAVGVRDREYRGGPDMGYRLHVGPVPVVTGVFPLGVPHGLSHVRVDGVNLGRPFPWTVAARPAFFLGWGPALVRVPAGSVPLIVPADTSPGSRVSVKVPPLENGDTPVGTASVVVDEFSSVRVGPDGTASLSAVPATADGEFAKPGEVHTIRFAAKKGESLVVEVNARRLGSPVDSAIEIVDADGRPVPRAVLRSTAKTYVTLRDHDSDKPGIRLETWTELAINDYVYADGELMRIFNLPRNPDDDCVFYAVGGKRVGFLGTTPAFHPFAGTLYRVEPHPPGTTFAPNGMPVFPVHYRNDDGGPGYDEDSMLVFEPPADGSYRVRVRDARGAGGPGYAYRLTVRPPRPDFRVSFAPTAPAVWKGGGVPVAATVTRVDGFDAPVRVRLDGLPPGFHAPATTVDGHLTTTVLALSADVGATVPAKAAAPRLVATATVGGREVTRVAAGKALKLADGGDLHPTVRSADVAIRPGHESRFVVDVERRNGFKGRVPLDVRGLPHGVRVLDVGLSGILVTERQTSREVVLFAEPWVAPTALPFVVVARREGTNAEHAAPAVTLRVVK